jgi:hypothetical protein
LLRWFTLELGQELIGVFGSGEGTTALVPAVAQPRDRCHQLLDVGEVTASERLALDDREAVQEPAVAMAGMAGVSHLPGGHLQRDKQAPALVAASGTPAHTG